MTQKFLTMEDFLQFMASDYERREQKREQERQKQEQERLVREEKEKQERLVREEKEKQERLVREEKEKQERLEYEKKRDADFEVWHKKIGSMVGGIGNNNGDVAEEFFFSSLVKAKKLGNIKFDDVRRNTLNQRDGMKEEYDLMMTNGKYIAVVEVKWKALPKDLNQLKRKIEHFKFLFPEFKNFEVVGAIAGMSMPEDTEREALEKGYFVLKQVGNHMEVTAPQ